MPDDEPSDCVPTVAVDNLGVYVAELLHDADHLRWFRGMGCHRRQLKPSLYRRLADGTPAAEILEREGRLITRFRQRSLPMWPEGYPQDDWEQLFAMQHHGVPTRLLDWSESALAAAYFAADHDPAQCECAAGDCLPTVWVLDPVAFNVKNPRLSGYDPVGFPLATSDDMINGWEPNGSATRFAEWPVALHGTHNSARIVAQRGVFTVAGREMEPLEDSPNAREAGVLRKLEFGCSHAQLMSHLRLLGVTRSAVYPDLASLGADITRSELGA